MIRRNFMQFLATLLPTALIPTVTQAKQTNNFILFGKSKYYFDENNQICLIAHECGAKLWYKNGLLHRDDGPAIEWPNGKKEWIQNGIKLPPNPSRATSN